LGRVHNQFRWPGAGQGRSVWGVTGSGSLAARLSEKEAALSASAHKMLGIDYALLDTATPFDVALSRYLAQRKKMG